MNLPSRSLRSAPANSNDLSSSFNLMGFLTLETPLEYSNLSLLLFRLESSNQMLELPNSGEEMRIFLKFKISWRKNVQFRTLERQAEIGFFVSFSRPKSDAFAPEF